MSSYKLPTIKEIRDLVQSRVSGFDTSIVEIVDSDSETGVVLTNVRKDSDTGAMLYLDEDHEKSVIDFVRGAAFAVVNGECIMVHAPTPRLPTIVSDSFTVDFSKDEVVLYVDSRVGKMEFKSTTPPIFTPFSEGAMVSIWKFRGKVYYSNNKSLQYNKTKWNECSHKETFERLGLPEATKFFPENVLTDPRSHTLIASDYHFMTDSRQILTQNAGYITYTGVKFSFDPSDGNQYFKRTETEGDLREYAGPWTLSPFTYTPPIDVAPAQLDEVIEPFTRKPMTLEQANDFLKHGYYEDFELVDPRMSSGDSLHVQIGSHSLRIQPPGSYWRNKIRSHDPSVRHMMYMHLATSFTNWKDFEEHYMYLDPPSLENLKKVYAPIKNEDGTESKSYFIVNNIKELDPLSAQKYEREHSLYRWLVFCNVLMSLNYQDQINSLGYFEEFEKDRLRAIDYISEHCKNAIYYADPEKFPTVGRINNPPVTPKGKIYKSDASGFIHDVSSIRLHKGQTLALLSRPHPQVQKIKSNVTKTMEDDRRDKKRYQNMRTLINREFNKLDSNHIYQIMKQSKAWYK